MNNAEHSSIMSKHLESVSVLTSFLMVLSHFNINVSDLGIGRLIAYDLQWSLKSSKLLERLDDL